MLYHLLAPKDLSQANFKSPTSGLGNADHGMLASSILHHIGNSDKGRYRGDVHNGSTSRASRRISRTRLFRLLFFHRGRDIPVHKESSVDVNLKQVLEIGKACFRNRIKGASGDLCLKSGTERTCTFQSQSHLRELTPAE